MSSHLSADHPAGAGTGTPRSRSSSATYTAAAAARPRGRRFLTGFDNFSEEDLGPAPGAGAGTGKDSAAGAAAAATASESALLSPTSEHAHPFFARVPSPLPSKHPSRASSQKPDGRLGMPQNGDRDLAASLSGLFGKSWTSLQGLASNVLGSDALSISPESNKDRHPRSRRTTPNSSRPGTAKQWGPPAQPVQPGVGSKTGRSATIRAQKQQELLAGSGFLFPPAGPASHKRRTSDDFGPPGSTSASPDAASRDTLAYIHHVGPTDTLAGICIRYNCQLALLKRTNRLWSNDGVQARKTLVLPVAACNVRGRRVGGPETTVADLLSGSLGDAGDDDDDATPTAVSYKDASGHAHGHGNGHAPANGNTTNSSGSLSKASGSDDTPWRHDSWVLLEGHAKPTEIARLPRADLGFFPRARRKSGSFSDVERSSASLEISRPSISVSESSPAPAPAGQPGQPGQPPPRQPLHRQRRSSGSNTFANSMLGPGGVGSLKGKGPSVPGPAEDQLTKVFRKQLSIKVDDDVFYASSAAASPGLADFGQLGHAMEEWAKKVGKGISKALEPAGPGGQRGIAYGSTTTGDLIELEAAGAPASIFQLDDDLLDGLDDDGDGPARGRAGGSGLAGSGLAGSLLQPPGFLGLGSAAGSAAASRSASRSRPRPQSRPSSRPQSRPTSTLDFFGSLARAAAAQATPTRHKGD